MRIYLWNSNDAPAHQATILFIEPMPSNAKSISCAKGLACATHRQEMELIQSRPFESISKEESVQNMINSVHANKESEKEGLNKIPPARWA